MLLYYYTQSLVLFLGLTTFKNNDVMKIMQNLDYEYLPQEVCVAQCLEQRRRTRTTRDLQYSEKSWIINKNEVILIVFKK